MIVADLRKELERLPDNAEVTVWDCANGGIVPAEIDFDESLFDNSPKAHITLAPRPED